VWSKCALLDISTLADDVNTLPRKAVSDYAMIREWSATPLRGSKKSHNAAKLNFHHTLRKHTEHHRKFSCEIIEIVIPWKTLYIAFNRHAVSSI
jgi:hypothetical protein